MSALELTLLPQVQSAATETDEVAYRIAAASVDVHRRDRKPYSHDHYARLVHPKDPWANTLDVFDAPAGEVVSRWSTMGETSWNVQPRLLPHLTGMPALGWGRGYANCEIVATLEGDVDIKAIGGKPDPWADLPVALTPGRPPNFKSAEAAIAEWVERVAAAGALSVESAAGLLRRVPPRLVDRALTPVTDQDNHVGALPHLTELTQARNEPSAARRSDARHGSSLTVHRHTIARDTCRLPTASSAAPRW